MTVFLTNSLSPKDPDTSLSLKDPTFLHLIVKQVAIFGKKIGFFDKCDEMLKIFWPFWPWKPLFFDAFHWKTPYFCALCHWKTPFFYAICHWKTLHLRCLVALVRHFHMWVPPHWGCFIYHLIICHPLKLSWYVWKYVCCPLWAITNVSLFWGKIMNPDLIIIQLQWIFKKLTTPWNVLIFHINQDYAVGWEHNKRHRKSDNRG